MINLLVTILATLAPAHALENMQFLTSDSSMRCAREDFTLDLVFDGTGDNVAYKWNGSPGVSPVVWKNNVAVFGLSDAQNGPFKLVFKDAHFYFQNVLCSEAF